MVDHTQKHKGRKGEEKKEDQSSPNRAKIGQQRKVLRVKKKRKTIIGATVEEDFRGSIWTTKDE